MDDDTDCLAVDLSHAISDLETPLRAGMLCCLLGHSTPPDNTMPSSDASTASNRANPTPSVMWTILAIAGTPCNRGSDCVENARYQAVDQSSISLQRYNFQMTQKNQAVRVRPAVGRAKEFADKRLVVTLVKGTRAAINAVRGKQSMTEFCREAIAREIARRLESRKGGGKP
jgi:hypothetical protein